MAGLPLLCAGQSRINGLPPSLRGGEQCRRPCHFCSGRMVSVCLARSLHWAETFPLLRWGRVPEFCPYFALGRSLPLSEVHVQGGVSARVDPLHREIETCPLRWALALCGSGPIATEGPRPAPFLGRESLRELALSDHGADTCPFTLGAGSLRELALSDRGAETRPFCVGRGISLREQPS